MRSAAATAEAISQSDRAVPAEERDYVLAVRAETDAARMTIVVCRRPRRYSTQTCFPDPRAAGCGMARPELATFRRKFRAFC